MLIISFSWTTPALLAYAKTCTRRNWPSDYARRFKTGVQCEAWNRSPKYGGEKKAVIEIVKDAYPERTSHMPDSDYEAEGFAWMERVGIMMPATLLGGNVKIPAREFWTRWKEANELMYVVRFKLVSIL